MTTTPETNTNPIHDMNCECSPHVYADPRGFWVVVYTGADCSETFETKAEALAAYANDFDVVSELIMTELGDLIIQIGHGFHGDNRGADYTSLPEGVTPEMYDRIVDTAWSLDIDVNDYANDLLNELASWTVVDSNDVPMLGLVAVTKTVADANVDLFNAKGVEFGPYRAVTA